MALQSCAMKIMPCHRVVAVKAKGLGMGIVLWALTLVMGAQAGPQGIGSPVLMIGDSMMRLPGPSMERELAKHPAGIQASTFAGIGTGLARLDAFDWMAKIDELCAERKPKVAVVALGANDRQPMELTGGSSVVQPGTPEWDAEYSSRIGKSMDHLQAGGCERIIWLLLPPMRDPVADAFAKHINEMAVAAAATRPAVTLHDFSKMFADRRTGGYAERVMDPKTAESIPVRERDGVHLSPEGARMLSMALVKEYWP